MPENHRNDDESYTVYYKDANGITRNFTCPPGDMADGLEEADRTYRNSDITWSHFAVITVKPGEDEEDPLEKISDPEADVEETVIGGTIKISEAVLKIKEAVRTLPPQLMDTYVKRYVLSWTYEDIAKAADGEDRKRKGSGTGKTTYYKQDRKIRSIVEKYLKENGIDEDYFDTYRRE